MRFGPVPVAEAVGLVAAHGLKAGGVALRKGRTITDFEAAALASAGVASVMAVALGPDDVGEDEAAGRLVAALAGGAVRVEPPFTGRANLFAEEAGILLVARPVVDGVNGIDEAVTVATLPAFRPVVAGEMVATVKIIPYAVAGLVLAAALAEAIPALAVAPYRLRRVGAVSTMTPGFKESVVAKTIGVLAARLAPAGAAVTAESVTAHEAGAVADALAAQVAGGAELIVVFGASAIADRHDVVPAAIERAGGAVAHLGMPVDPGNLLLVGRIGAVPVIGAPGCARSPVENGFDWVLSRLLAGLEVTRADIVTMGVGGLLMEVVQRGHPRAGGPAEE